jgi:hypothetical protein
MAEEEKSPSTTGGESLVHISREFVDVLAASRRRTDKQDQEVEGHAMGVEEFNSISQPSPVVCGVIYSSN